jgi:hypothetical protein
MSTASKHITIRAHLGLLGYLASSLALASAFRLSISCRNELCDVTRRKESVCKQVPYCWGLLCTPHFMVLVPHGEGHCSRLTVNGFKPDHLVWARQGSRQAEPNIPIPLGSLLRTAKTYKKSRSTRLGHYYVRQV